MNNLLNQLAFESGLVEPEAAPEEITIITDDTVTELEEHIDDLASDVEKCGDGAKAAEKMIDVIESLEGKIALLRDMRTRGENLGEVAAKLFADNVSTAFESRQFPTGVYTGNLTEMVTSFESHQRYDYSAEAEKQTESLVVKVKAMLSKALDSFIQWIKNTRSKLSGMNKSIGALGQKLIVRAKSIAPNATSDRKVKLSGFGLIAKSASDVDPVSALDAVKAAGGKVTTVEGTLAGAIGEASKALATGNAESAKEAIKIPGGLTSIELSGGKSLKMDGSGLYKVDGTATETSGEATPLSGVEIANVGRKLVDLGMTLDISEADAKSLISKLESAIDAVIKNLGEKGLSSSGPALKTFNQGLNSIKSLRAGLNAHAGATAKQAYTFASMSANRY